MNICFFVVNFKADDHLTRFVESVRIAREACPGTCVKLHVLDNSKKSPQEQVQLHAAFSSDRSWAYPHFLESNDGYFGCLKLAQALVPPDTDCVIYCNPDVVLAPDFFLVLSHKIGGGAGIIAPAILSQARGFDQNPKYCHRLSARKLKRLQYIYSHRLSYLIFNKIAQVKEIFSGLCRTGSSAKTHETVQIYAPHGSVFVFTDVVFFLGLPAFPCFLFGEELFVAEEARLSGVQIVYEPRLKVQDVRHASIAMLDADFRRVLMQKSVSFILERYYAR